MTPLLVVNRSPLIHLATADKLDLLHDAAETIWVPQAVADEIRTYGTEDPTARALAVNVWLEVKAVPAVAAEILA